MTGKYLVTLVLPGREDGEQCDCPICKAAGIDLDSIPEGEPLVTPLNETEAAILKALFEGGES